MNKTLIISSVYSNSLLSLLNGRLHLGYQTEAPFMISLSTFHQSNRSRSQVQFSVRTSLKWLPIDTMIWHAVSSHNSSEASIGKIYFEIPTDEFGKNDSAHERTRTNLHFRPGLPYRLIHRQLGRHTLHQASWLLHRCITRWPENIDCHKI